MRYRRVFAMLSVLLPAAGAVAAGSVAGGDCAAGADDCVAVGRWNVSVALGAGARSDPVADSTNIPLVVVPHVSYYGTRFFLDNLDFGVTLAEGETQTLSIVASPGYDRVFFYRSDLQNLFIAGLPADTLNSGGTGPTGVDRFPQRPRRWTYLAGPEWTFRVGALSGQLDVLHDVTGRNDGTEVRAAVGIPLVEGHGTLTANVGLTWKSAAIVNYYYGQSAVYDADAALSPFAKLGYRRPLGGKWQFIAFAHYERLGRSIADSPIVSEHYVATVFAGASYSF